MQAGHIPPFSVPHLPLSYDLGLIGGAMLEISRTFSITSSGTKEAIVGAAKLGAFFGTFLGGAMMLRYGRRIAMASNSIFFTAGPIIMAAAWGPGWVAHELFHGQEDEARWCSAVQIFRSARATCVGLVSAKHSR